MKLKKYLKEKDNLYLYEELNHISKNTIRTFTYNYSIAACKQCIINYLSSLILGISSSFRNTAKTVTKPGAIV